MATGALDANGIWQYGEDDSETTFSALLNKLGGSTSTTVTRLEEMGGITSTQAATARDNLRVGLVPISPSSVVIATGTGSANTLGVVTYTGATSISLNGVFSSEFKNYKIIVVTDSVTVATNVNFRLRSAGTDYSTANYNRMGTTTNAAGATAAYTGTSTTQHALGTVSNATNTGAGEFIISNPFTSIRKTIDGSFSGYSGSNPAAFYGGGYVNTTSSYDGLTYFPSTGTITGTIQVFGYND